MKIAVAKIDVSLGLIKENIATHIKLINVAVREKVDVIIFPEMSITGYCREEGAMLAFSKNDSRLNLLREIATLNNITIIAGAPIVLEDKLYIGSFIIKPNGLEEVYTKQYLHLGEEVFYESSFLYNPQISIEEEKLAFAICADIDKEAHPKQAKKDKATVYLPSIFFSKEGIEKGHEQLQMYAQKYSLPVLMSNFCGEHWNTKAGGKSAFWSGKGELLTSLNENEEGLVIVEKVKNKWTSYLKM